MMDISAVLEAMDLAGEYANASISSWQEADSNLTWAEGIDILKRDTAYILNRALYWQTSLQIQWAGESR